MSDKDLSRNKKLRLLYTFVSVLISGFYESTEFAFQRIYGSGNFD